MRKPIVGISYKTYINSIQETFKMLDQIVRLTGTEKKIEQVIFPSIGTLYPAAQVLKGSNIALGAQNISPEKNGPFTGELSIESVKEIGGRYVEIGHAERKTIFKESQEMINKKTRLTLEEGLFPFLCIGEEEQENNDDLLYNTFNFQISSALNGIHIELIKNVIIAYEPFWAIGKSFAAEPEYIHKSHDIIRNVLADLYGKEISKQIRIIYGGSVSKDSTPFIINNNNVDGLFIGRFGHNPENYNEILRIVMSIKC
ncbi:triose-phosphate isomerase [Caldifermentibacillus hisashii]|uniref:triose-phosphate isomerase family protein n=1 Tax=Bacillaceae TaxID=186817 RepID=UPI00203B2973|nr:MULTISPECIES: triose-phosphate isomerase family protein [Bacillaceae]MCM3054883.1 triose-phosphate isomerase [Caldibacillus thermoamylovorans]MED4853038.1 triose-phosphate isomerase [Caldifermentibacillus hisashii]